MARPRTRLALLGLCAVCLLVGAASLGSSVIGIHTPVAPRPSTSDAAPTKTATAGTQRPVAPRPASPEVRGADESGTRDSTASEWDYRESGTADYDSLTTADVLRFPQCRPLGVPFARAVLEWLRRPATTGGVPRRLVYNCEADKAGRLCGGMGDRFRGMITTAMLALLSNRRLELYQTVPVPLQRYLRPQLVNWVPRPADTPPSGGPITHEHVARGLEPLPLDGSLMSAKKHSAFLRQLARYDATGTPGLRVMSNSFGIDRAAQKVPAFRDAWAQRLGLRLECNLTCYYGCMHALLFRPGPELRRVVAETLLPQHRGEVEWDRTGTSIARPTVPPFIAAQIRMGGSWARGFTVAEPFRTAPEAVPHFFAAIAELRRGLGPNGAALRGAPLFITSDAPRLINDTVRHFGRPAVLEVAGDAFGHTDSSHLCVARPGKWRCPTGAVKTYLLTLANHHLIGLAAHVVMAQSGFGDTAFWRGRRQATAIFVEMSNLRRGWQHHLSYGCPAASQEGGAPVCEQPPGPKASPGQCGCPSTASMNRGLLLRDPPRPYYGPT